MPFQMNFSREEFSGSTPAPDGWYTLQIKGFRPRAAKNGESVSLNAELAIIGGTDHDGKRVFVGLNTKMAWMWADFIHATGLQMEVVQDEFAGTEKENLTIPGVFEGSDTNPDDPSQWKYQGPLLNKTLEAELATREYNGKKSNDVRQFKCAVAGCTEKHSTNLIKN